MTIILPEARICSFLDCGRDTHGQGLCNGHWQMHIKRGEPLRPLRARFKSGEAPTSCGVEGCDRRHFARGLCRSHWQHQRDGKPLGVIRHQKPTTASGDRKTPPSGKGFYDGNGYVYLTGFADHPNAFPASGRIQEHILIMTQHLGRALIHPETVHHKNGQRDDNRLSNLELWSSAQPAGQRVEDKVVFAKEILALYEPDALR